MHRSSVRLPAILTLSLAALLFAAPDASALEEDCTWFPDIRCGRHGRWDGFVMPMSMPYLFEDPFITTGVQAVGIWHDYPTGGDAIFKGGEMWVTALQARIAITDRLAFIATKDGYAWHRPDNKILKNESGFFDIAAGFKYALYQNEEKRIIVTPSLRLDIPVGNHDVFSGNGDSVFIPAVSGAWGGIDNFNVIANFGARLPVDTGEESTSFFYNLHLSYNVLDWLVPFVEFNGTHWVDSGNGNFKVDLRGGGKITLSQAQAALGTGDFEAVDVANLGSEDVAGNDLATFAVGARFPITKHISLGASYEFPMTAREDIFNQRVTAMVLFEY